MSRGAGTIPPGPTLVLAAVVALLAGACGGSAGSTIAIDGSSTVAPLTDAVAEEYAAEEPEVSVAVGVSGTGGGFERFCGSGDVDISNASRPISDAEAQQCADNGVEFTRLRVGTDALTMVVNNDNPAECLDDDQITQIWGPDPVAAWSEVDGVDFDESLEVFAPASTSGTYDFFNETVLEPQGIELPRQSYSATENDNDIVRGVEGTDGGWGFFGFAFFTENRDAVKALAYDAGGGCVAPSVEAAQDDSYGLTRPLFIYVKNSSLADKPSVRDFVSFYLDTVNEVIADIGYIPVSEQQLQEARSKLAAVPEPAASEQAS